MLRKILFVGSIVFSAGLRGVKPRENYDIPVIQIPSSMPVVQSAEPIEHYVPIAQPSCLVRYLLCCCMSVNTRD